MQLESVNHLQIPCFNLLGFSINTKNTLCEIRETVFQTQKASLGKVNKPTPTGPPKR